MINPPPPTMMCRVMVAAKFYDDSFYNNEFYAKVGGVSVDELNELELEFMFLIGFSLIIPLDEYQKLHNNLYIHCKKICSHCRNSLLELSSVGKLMFPSLYLDSSFSPSILNYSLERTSRN